MSFARHHIAALAVIGTVTLPGCEFIEELTGPGDTVVDVFAAHHQSANEGEFPPPAPVIELDTDMGFHIVLSEAVITTQSVSIEHCNGSVQPIDMYWGALPEDVVLDDDLALTGVGGVTLEAGDYCGVLVEYGPFMGPNGPDDHDLATEEAAGKTVYLRGAAYIGDDIQIPFEWSTSIALMVRVDLSEDPLHISGNEAFDEKLTVTKTYDRFFDGVDFQTLSDGDIDDLLLDTLVNETRVVKGTSIRPD